MLILSQRYFWDEQAAHAKLEEIVWPKGPVCIRCGATDRIGAVTGKGARAGLKFCCRCRRQFRATIGTVFEGSHVPLHKWFQACFMLSAAGRSVTAYQLHRQLEVTNKTAVGMIRRLGERVINAQQASCRTGADWLSRPDGSADRPLAQRGIAERLASIWAAQPLVGPMPVPSNTSHDEVPQSQPSPRPTRQFRRFVETARELGGIDEEGFDRLLAELGVQLGHRSHNPRGSGSGKASTPSATEPPGDTLVPAAA
jgi:transposase-like protein